MKVRTTNVLVLTVKKFQHVFGTCYFEKRNQITLKFLQLVVVYRFTHRSKGLVLSGYFNKNNEIKIHNGYATVMDCVRFMPAISRFLAGSPHHLKQWIIFSTSILGGVLNPNSFGGFLTIFLLFVNNCK